MSNTSSHQQIRGEYSTLQTGLASVDASKGIKTGRSSNSCYLEHACEYLLDLNNIHINHRVFDSLVLLSIIARHDPAASFKAAEVRLGYLWVGLCSSFISGY